MRTIPYFLAGLVFMALAWAKHRLQGYKTPTPFSADDEEKSAVHAARIVGEWRGHLERYCGDAWRGHDVLELGPGGTLGTGVHVLMEGAHSYEAVDKFGLAENLDTGLYEKLLAGSNKRDEILHAVEKPDRPPLTYTVVPDFRVDRALGARRFDRMVSCAAFEHFDDVPDTIERMTRIAAPGAIACIHVDFCTHSRWLRHRDPNNIYRYPEWLYWLLPFPGKPNRVRPDEYLEEFKRKGWTGVDFYPVRNVPDAYPATIGHGFARRFRRPEARMEVLSGAVMATMPG